MNGLLLWLELCSFLSAINGPSLWWSKIEIRKIWTKEKQRFMQLLCFSFQMFAQKCRPHWFTPVWRCYFIIDLTSLFDFKKWFQLKWNENTGYKYLAWTGHFHVPLLETRSTGLRSTTFQHHDEVRSLVNPAGTPEISDCFQSIRKHY